MNFFQPPGSLQFGNPAFNQPFSGRPGFPPMARSVRPYPGISAEFRATPKRVVYNDIADRSRDVIADYNGDGVTSRSENYHAVMSYGVTPFGENTPIYEENSFISMDIDGSGAIEHSERAAFSLWLDDLEAATGSNDYSDSLRVQLASPSSGRQMAERIRNELAQAEQELLNTLGPEAFRLQPLELFPRDLSSGMSVQAEPGLSAQAHGIPKEYFYSEGLDASSQRMSIDDINRDGELSLYEYLRADERSTVNGFVTLDTDRSGAVDAMEGLAFNILLSDSAILRRISPEQVKTGA